ncbi:uncharacterized protein AC631_05620 [Debaryomyces fabryi]|uniref:Uncharacterized protein n=1 Tax=Debaryomyces fabryi TaxID=58627 RepID=A0A0V1PQU5_9ASCO|nr:uncharacterized protein AC631_05620 [Debaryomyces fabryi]KRZ98615.1 hypothetical protein AC631_05620 [Debaryomyces fabryi]CUM45904.1 unnamed protein product [Debaryomyces fabryi]
MYFSRLLLLCSICVFILSTIIPQELVIRPFNIGSDDAHQYEKEKKGINGLMKRWSFGGGSRGGFSSGSSSGSRGGSSSGSSSGSRGGSSSGSSGSRGGSSSGSSSGSRGGSSSGSYSGHRGSGGRTGAGIGAGLGIGAASHHRHGNSSNSQSSESSSDSLKCDLSGSLVKIGIALLLTLA